MILGRTRDFSRLSGRISFSPAAIRECDLLAVRLRDLRVFVARRASARFARGLVRRTTSWVARRGNLSFRAELLVAFLRILAARVFDFLPLLVVFVGLLRGFLFVLPLGTLGWRLATFPVLITERVAGFFLVFLAVVLVKADIRSFRFHE